MKLKLNINKKTKTKQLPLTITHPPTHPPGPEEGEGGHGLKTNIEHQIGPKTNI